MIKHHAFFEALGNTEEKTPEWHSTFAGLSVLRLVDRSRDLRELNQPQDPHQLDAARRAIESIAEGDPARAILLRIVDALRRNLSDSELGSDLVSYGRSLDLVARWRLAADVFSTVVEEFSARENPDLVIESSTALGAAMRNIGDWAASERAYARAEYLAESIGDRAASLTVKVGLANSEMFRGNLRSAETELQAIVDEAHALGFESVEAIALHASASAAHLKGDFQRAIHLAYRSLELTTNTTARERVVADIAAAYGALGMREPARNAYSIVAITSPHQWVRWQATLNLMELAIDEDDEAAFDDYVNQLDDAALEPRLRTYYLFFKAKGTRQFGRDDSPQLFQQARAFAETNKLHQLAFEIESAMSKESPQRTVQPNEELAQIAEVLEHLRQSAST